MSIILKLWNWRFLWDWLTILLIISSKLRTNSKLPHQLSFYMFRVLSFSSSFLSKLLQYYNDDLSNHRFFPLSHLQNPEGFRFTTKPTSVKNLEIGSMGKVHCKAVGSLKIHWIKDARDRLPGDVEDVNGTLIFNNVRMEHRGNYTCVATNDASVIQTSVDVRIVPTFSISPPESLEIVEMQIVFLDCQATGSPAPTIKWFHEGSEITTEGRFRIFENGTLQLRETRQDDAGQYECFAGSSAGFKRVESLLIVKGEWKAWVTRDTDIRILMFSL